jgi:hypothetical protein
MQQATCKLKMAKCSWNVVKLDNNLNVWRWQKTRFLFVIFDSNLISPILSHIWLQTLMTTMVCNIDIIIAIQLIDLDISCNDSHKHNDKIEKISSSVVFWQSKNTCVFQRFINECHKAF